MAHRPLLVLALAAAPAAAHAELLGARETACAVIVEFAGPIATVTETHELVGADAAPVEATYRFDLPAGAAVTDARVAIGKGAATPGLAVSAEALATTTPDRERLGLAPDRGLVRWLGSTVGVDSYEARVYPVAAGAPARLTVRWTAAAAYRDGRLLVGAPARGDADGLARCAITVRARPAGGVQRFTRAFVNGAAVATVGGKATVANARALAVEAVPAWRGSGPVVAMHSQPVGAGRALTSIGVYLPPRQAPAAFAPPRLLLVVDTTRSMGADGRAAAAAIADALVAATPATTPIELITFDRTARRALGAWTVARDARRRIKDALAAATPGGGTELSEALNLAATTIGDDPARVVVITDAILSTRVTGADLLGAAQMPVNLATLDVIVPVVAGAPMPDRGVLDPLVAAFHGKVIALRTSEVTERVATLPRQLADDLPLRDLGVVVDDEVMAIDWPGELTPGSGVVAHVSHAGATARRVRLTAQRGPDPIGAAALALPKAVGAVAVAAAGRGDVARDTAGLDPTDVLALARQASTVTPLSALAIIDPTAPGAGPRADLARTTGAFTRTPPAGSDALDVPPPDEPAPATATAADDNLPDTTYKYLIKYQLWPAVRTCYATALRGKPRFTGTLEVTLEIARGEVHAARFGGTALPSEFVACVGDASYAIEVPTYGLDGLAETIAIVKKPIHLHVDEEDPQPTLDVDLGLPAEEPAPPPLK